jgi:dTDP-4-dehydrorhamnose 3,5-epimerase-like enzyme
MSFSDDLLFSDKRGDIYTKDLYDLPFVPKRIFVINNVPKNTTRGRHGHKTCHQFFICLGGKIEFYNVDLVVRCKKYVILTKGMTLYLPNLIWSRQQYIEDNSELLCLCSEKYDKNDYMYGLPT